MRLRWVLTTTVAVALAGLLGAPGAGAFAPAKPAASIDTRDRSDVVDAYRTWLEPLLEVPTGWTGNADRCKPGTISRANARATLSAVNYMRAMGGLPPVRLDAGLSRKSQAAALIMTANGYLTHTPSRSAKCWTRAGYDGASHGNIFLGWGYGQGDSLASSTGPRAVVGYMVDPGASNELVGHRRWLMFSELATIGTGDTYTANSIYVISPNRRATADRWVSWPTAGYFPLELEPAGRWSLSHPAADFSRARVTVRGPDGRVRVQRHRVANGYGDNTLSWDMRLPNGYSLNGSSSEELWRQYFGEYGPTPETTKPDYRVRVSVTGIRLAGRTVSRTWTTTLVQAATPGIGVVQDGWSTSRQLAGATTGLDALMAGGTLRP